MAMTNTVVRVISMASAVGRREQFAAGAQGIQLPWAFFDALTGPRLPLVHEPHGALVRAGRALRPGELGCYASHYAVWQEFLDTPAKQLLVFEDDVLVDWVAVQRLAAQDFASIGVHVLKLFATFPIQARTVRHKFYSDHSHLVRVQGYCYGTQAYLLTRTAARALLESCAVLDMPIDWAMSRYWVYGHPNYAVVPYPVIERLVPSSIGHPPAQRGSQAATARGQRLVWRVRDRARRLVVDLGARWEPSPQAIDGAERPHA
jgi:glycosyl transferase family 25